MGIDVAAGVLENAHGGDYCSRLFSGWLLGVNCVCWGWVIRCVDGELLEVIIIYNAWRGYSAMSAGLCVDGIHFFWDYDVHIFLEKILMANNTLVSYVWCLNTKYSSFEERFIASL